MPDIVRVERTKYNLSAQKSPATYPLTLPPNCILAYDFQERDNPAGFNILTANASRSFSAPYTNTIWTTGTSTMTTEVVGGYAADGGTHWDKLVQTAVGGGRLGLFMGVGSFATNIQPGQPYVASAYYKSNEAQSCIQVVRFYTSAFVQVGADDDTAIALTTEWARYTKPAIVAPATASLMAVSLKTVGDVHQNDWIGIDCAKIELGTSATAWTIGGTSYGVMPTVLDHSGRGYHGTVSGAYTVAASVGLARRFDYIDDIITLSAAASAALNALILSDVTFEFLVKASTAAVTHGIMTQINKANPERCFIIVLSGTGYPAIYQYPTGELATQFIYSSGTQITPGSWGHVAVTIKAAGAGTSTVAIYVNSVSAAITGSGGRTATTADPLHASTADVQIGKEPLNGKYFDGDMRMLRVYNSCKSAAEVKDLYNEIGWLVGLPQK